jgi:hypothetical protein
VCKIFPIFTVNKDRKRNAEDVEINARQQKGVQKRLRDEIEEYLG